MDEKTYKPFEEFYKVPTIQEIQESNKTAEEILLDVRTILESHKWG